MDAEDLARWSARVAFALYIASLVAWAKITFDAKWRDLTRWLWTAACAAMLVHVAIAFDQVHHWSHRAAYVDTAKQTAGVTGLHWGGGIYANYALLLVWLLDVLWWWSSAVSYESRVKAVTWSIHGFLAFMWFNAAVVFAHGWMRWAGLAGFLAAAAMSCRGKINSSNTTKKEVAESRR